jgi:hypothetical protein
MYDYKYKVIILEESDNGKLIPIDDEVFDDEYEVRDFFANIKDKRKHYKFVYETYKINYELIDVSSQKDIVCDCE